MFITDVKEHTGCERNNQNLVNIPGKLMSSQSYEKFSKTQKTHGRGNPPVVRLVLHNLLHARSSAPFFMKTSADLTWQLMHLLV